MVEIIKGFFKQLINTMGCLTQINAEAKRKTVIILSRGFWFYVYF